jgi:membrane-associated phospholipid phosphatase
VIKKTIRHSCSLLVLGAANAFASTPSLQGQSGYVNMPSAWVEADGTFTLGYSYDSPYGSTWATATVLPFLQVTGRYVSITGIPAFGNSDPGYGRGYGRYKDKVIDAKVNIVPESRWIPAVSVGATDLLGTELFKGQYIVASKVFGTQNDIEASIGYGNKRPRGAFAGVRWAPRAARGFALVAEYDANDYTRDYRAADTGAALRHAGPALGLEYRWGWLGAQLVRNRDRFGASAYLSIPFSEREFVPKIYEPPYFQAKDAPARASLEQWRGNRRYEAELVQALVKQDFKNVRAGLDGDVLHLTLTNSRIAAMDRAVGRAARTALAFAPAGTRAIRITYTRLEQPLATYEFLDLQRVTDYLTGLGGREAFLQTVLVRYAGPADTLDEGGEQLLAGIGTEGSLGVHVGREGDMVQLVSEDREANRFKVVPKLGFFFNDPSGALRYELAAAATYDRRLGRGLYLNGALRANVVENISGVTQASNSLLPHVRTDIAEYKRGGRLKLSNVMLNKYLQLDERLYARVSGGLYEEMYRGAGGQILYLPRDSRWAADLTVDALQQRGYKGWFDHLDYKTVTALGAMHYRLPYDLTATARVGRFLARDTGVRLEMARRFASGMEIGAWYTKTNGNDITMPGRPGNPYNDKGIFLSVPLNIMLPSDTQASAGMALAPWTRDVGQMVASPGDLYELMDKPRRDLTRDNGLGNFAERPDEPARAAAAPVPSPWPAFRWRLEQSISTTPSLPDWAGGAAIAGASLVASAFLDKPVDSLLQRHPGTNVTRHWDQLGRAAPVAFAGAAAAAVAFGDARASNTGIISLESVVVAAALSAGTKHLVHRARPAEGLGPWSRSCQCSDSSFPSSHAAIALATVTPFAKEFDAPWLYGLAAATSAGRVAGRKHWVSDVVGGGVAGYAVGSWLWRSQRDDRSDLAVSPGLREVSVTWRGSY